MRKKSAILALCLVFLLCGCSKGMLPDKNSDTIYFVNMDGTGLVSNKYQIEGKTLDDKIAYVLKQLEKPESNSEYKSPFFDGVKIEEWKITDSDLEIHFNAKYAGMSRSDKLLLCSSVVRSLTQIKGVDYLLLYSEERPVKDSSGKELGYLSAESFVDNTGASLHSYQDAKLHLYFTNKSGDKLVEEEVNVRYISNKSIEKVIVEQLIKGPKTKNNYPTIPSEAKVLGVSTKNGVCYVNFDEGLQEGTIGANPAVIIYSIVNSIIDSGTTGQVQIMINGESTLMFRDVVDLSGAFSRNLELVEGEE